MSWESLPTEIRLASLEAIFHTGDTAAYAAVSREWQTFFEQKHFERIVLSQKRLKSFARIVHGPKRKFVKHIWLRLDLKTYRCPDCTKFETCEVAEENNAIFTKSIKMLFQTLSNWKRSTDLVATPSTVSKTSILHTTPIVNPARTSCSIRTQKIGVSELTITGTSGVKGVGFQSRETKSIVLN